MIPNDALINALRSLGFVFKKQHPRVMLYKKQGETLRVEVRRRDNHDEQYARIVLRQAGMTKDNIDRFVAESKRQ